MRAPVISPTYLRFPPRARLRQWRVGLSDWIDTGGYVPPDSASTSPGSIFSTDYADPGIIATPPTDPSTSLPEITVSNTRITPPVWPLVLIIATVTYAAYYMGGHKR